jgi:hypothetical protein
MKSKIHPSRIALVSLNLLVILVFLIGLTFTNTSYAQEGDNPNPPAEPVKLIFIHHSTGENWLNDGYGNLGIELGNNNYFVSDTNYGWGPDGIGDRTDIPEWMEWFRSPETDRYMNALYNENGQNSYYTRRLSDPGGENQIVMFKSCFPNSELYGHPQDPPTEGYDFSVGNAKYVYNEILQYFASRTDKLFIVITAPPVQNPEYADNARAFNNWLMYDWLNENNYTGSNVAVFDFYNVLTHPDNHHRYYNGEVEHITNHGANTLHYDSYGDDHPNEPGSQKATDEFVTLLNLFYNRWLSGGGPSVPPSQPPTPSSSEGGGEEQPSSEQTFSSLPGGIIDNFDSGTPPGTEGWQAYMDEASQTTLRCETDSSMSSAGSNSLLMEFTLVPDSWAGCTLEYGDPIDWQGGDGISFYMHADRANLPFSVSIFNGTWDNFGSYSFYAVTTGDSVDDWELFEIPWDQFLRVDWEENPGTPVTPDQVLGLSFGPEGAIDTDQTGSIWFDEIQLINGGTSETAPSEPESPQSEETQSQQEGSEEDQTTEDEEGGVGGFCPLSMALPLMMLLGVVAVKKRE